MGGEKSGERSLAGEGRSDRRRRGFSVFVDNVGKRVSQATLRDLFQAYGVVLDVYIAYSNPRRKLKSSTFAFVRYKNRDDACQAVTKGAGRVIDGSPVRVFLSYNNREATQRSEKVKKVWRRVSSLRDIRTFKEVVWESQTKL
ncbi:serine/arginine-rich splicing factor SC35-like [Hibiscus syriacus]|uniref:serine/arginine-rich splicing factor SC35-like n=1 Tax=Hibiscus syriacus TaxID=106335 RepID=UPI00192270B7|nr:serine/arginine-rich splicing factor SC35-like [Hibiscus syriacus]